MNLSRQMHFPFIFQAKDSIRYHCVTGVQTCALPISPTSRRKRATCACAVASMADASFPITHVARSEERRVGKECGSRWWLENQKKDTIKWRNKNKSFKEGLQTDQITVRRLQIALRRL